jgi:hypothetical protein
MNASSSQADREIPTVREDPDLTPLEKETSIHFSKGDDDADVFTAERGLTRRLLAHELFTVDTILLKDGSRSDSIQSLDASEDVVVGVQGTLPIGCLKVRASTRSHKYGHAPVVSTADTVADAGGGGSE